MARGILTLGREIIAEPPDVWKVLANVDRYPRVLTSVEKVERVSGTGFELGTSWRETRRFEGRSSAHLMTITAVEEGRSAAISVEAAEGGVALAYRVRPTSLGTRLEMDVTGDPGAASGVSKLILGSGGGLFRVAKEMFEQDLKDFGAALRT